MGQKINPLSLRIGTQKDWKTKTAETKNWGAGGVLEKNRQTDDFVKLFFRKAGFGVTSLNVKKLAGEVCVFVSIFSVPERKKMKAISPSPAVKEILAFGEVIANKKFLLPSTADLLKKGMLFAYPNKKITIYLNYDNKQLNLTTKKRIEAKKKFLTLRRYKTRDYYIEGFNSIFALTNDRKFSKPLLEFMVRSIKATKQLKPLLKFIEKSLKLITDNPKSQTTGARIEIRGRFNKAGRSRFFLLKVGDVPRHARKIPLDYVSGHTHNKNGSFGVKVWVVGKPKNVSST